MYRYKEATLTELIEEHNNRMQGNNTRITECNKIKTEDNEMG